MSDVVISIENLSKSYRLGVIGTGTFYGDLKRWWARQRDMPDPYQKIGEIDYGNRIGEIIWALKDISFKVRQGEAIGIIGHNGAGKSTLLKILAQVTAPTTGVAKIKGRVASLLEVGTGFHPELTGRENILLNGAIMGMSQADVKRRLDEIVEFSGVERFIDTPVKRYSSGMYVRLAFAVAAHLEPDILIVDEVLAVGDAAFQKKCLGKMGDVTKEGRTVLFVSHNLGAVSGLTRSSVCIHKGQIVDRGDTDSVIKNYLSLVSVSTSEEGWADLNKASHAASDKRLGKLEWIRTFNSQDQQTGTFFEGEPIRVEIGFTLDKPTTGVELACSVRPLNNSPLFISPSGQHDIVQPGQYSISYLIKPNYLASGTYTLGLYFIVKGQKEDAVHIALQITVVAQLSQNGNPFFIKYGQGYMLRFDYEWKAPCLIGDHNG